ncbi:hypothetical protein BHM03_00045056 [Ensete ventricosum]|nr:hypothetical protein BHM03_00045056 [Ensete ventricosum]
MRLNRVELFYTLVVAIGSESRHCLRGRGGHMHAVCMQRWLAMAWLLARGGRLRPGPLQGAIACRCISPHGATTRGHGRLRPHRGGRQRSARKGLPPTTNPTASKGGGAGRRGGRPLAGRLPATKGSHRLRQGSDGGDKVRVKDG